MRELSNKEICILEEQGCRAEEWSDILVDDDFTSDSVRNVSFYGHVEIGNLNGTLEVEEGFRRRCCICNASLRNVVVGDECIIENVGGYINGYALGNRCYISNVGVMTCQEGASFGHGTVISVLNEGGKGNVTLHEDLTAQMAWFMINGVGHNLVSQPKENKYDSRSLAGDEIYLAHVGNESRIVGVREMSNVKVGECCEIQGASRLDNCTLLSSDDASTFIGCDVIIENSIVAAGATLTDGAKVMECFVGESVHIGKGFSAESSLFFANSYMDNGEACASLCGPFSTSHHKSTLLIGGSFSFYNAGSNTNQSNHAYKMGPIHWGMLDRGSKTASGCHILWPAHIGAFSMAMGKIKSHPDVYKLPFSYVIAEGEKTYLVPGVNIKTVGTWRDVKKWPKRDLRPLSSRNDIINFAFPNPYIIQYVLEGREILMKLTKLNKSEYEYKGCVIKHEAALRGIQYYELIVRLFLYEYFSNNKEELEDARGERWLDVCGMLAPKSEIDRVIQDIQSGAISSTTDLKVVLSQINRDYGRSCASYARFVVQHLGDSMFVDKDRWLAEAEEAHAQWLNMVRLDAEKEFQMGDVDEDTLREFLKGI
ncbi:MAG: DUF4954 family protein [Bacteroidaceae bacterium]|nr:DUF4954 family protein [Bacteroidaceae bacterium]